MHDAGGQRQPLLPAARERPASWRRREVRPSVASVSRTAARGVGQAVEAGDEVEVLLDREVLVEREPLGHVADLRLDRAALGAEVVAEHLALALVEA